MQIYISMHFTLFYSTHQSLHGAHNHSLAVARANKQIERSKAPNNPRQFKGSWARPMPLPSPPPPYPRSANAWGRGMREKCR